jgi:hypothetical protein
MRNKKAMIFYLGALFLLANWQSACLDFNNPVEDDPVGTIRGQIVSQSQISTALRTSGQPVEGARCVLEGTNRSVTSNADGIFMFEYVMEGSYILICRIDQRALLQIAEVKEGQVTELGMLEITPTGSISGVVTLFEMTDHAGIQVSIPGTSMQGQTDSQGNFVLSDVPAGEYELRMERAGYLPANKLVEVFSDKITKIDPVVLQVSTGVTGTITIKKDQECSNQTLHKLQISWTEGTTIVMISESVDFLGAEWEPVKEEIEWEFNYIAAGTYTIYAKFADANGLTSGVVQDQITIDQKGPLGTVGIKGLDWDAGQNWWDWNYTGLQEVEIYLVAEDTDIYESIEDLLASTDGAGDDTGCGVVEYQISNQPDLFGADWTTVSDQSSEKIDLFMTIPWNLSEGYGEKTVYVRFRDGAGNVSEIYSDTIVYSRLVPEMIDTNLVFKAGVHYLPETVSLCDSCQLLIEAGAVFKKDPEGIFDFSQIVTKDGEVIVEGNELNPVGFEDVKFVCEDPNFGEIYCVMNFKYAEFLRGGIQNWGAPGNYVEIEDSVFEESYIFFSGCSLLMYRNTFENCSGGIHLQYNEMIINNVFFDSQDEKFINISHICWVDHISCDGNLTIKYNSFLDSGRKVLNVHEADDEIVICNPNALELSENYWGTTDEAIIQTMIDSTACPGTEVIYTPYLTEPHPDTPAFP